MVARAEDAARVVIYPAPAGEAASPDFSVEVDGKAVFVYSANVLKGGPASFAYFDFSGSVSVKVTARREVKSATIRPLSSGIAATIAGNEISFKLDKPRNLSIELNDGFEKPLLLFANPLETDVPVADTPNVVFFGPGVHEIGPQKFPSGTTVYIAGGAIVRGKILPDEKPIQEKNWAGNKVYTNLLTFEKATNVKVRGRGILDGSTLPWHSRCPIVFQGCDDFLVEGIIIKDSPCWCTPMFNSKNGRVINLKEICHRENSDGVNIVNSQEILLDGCFLRNNDDEICVKTTSGPPAPESKNITVKNCVVWNDRAYGIGITYETRANISNVVFQHCDVIHDHGIAALAIHMSDGATVNGVRFEDVCVEDSRQRFIKLWIGKDMWGHDPQRGNIQNVVFKNVSLGGGTLPPSELTGSDATHLIENVSFENLKIQGKRAASAQDAKLAVNPFAKNVTFAEK